MAVAVTWAPTYGHSVSAQSQCPTFDLNDAEAALDSVAVVLVADVSGVTGSAVALSPVVYLKGAASGATILLTRRDDGCELAAFEHGARVLAALPSIKGELAWPVVSQVFVIDAADELSENALVVQIRDVTSQFAFPAETNASGASIDWGGVILPVGIALLIVAIISYVMMIYWHRIDPS